MNNLIVGSATAVATFALSLPALADGGFYGPMHHGGWGFGLFPLIVLALIGVGAFLIVLLAVSLIQRQRSMTGKIRVSHEN